MNTKLSLLYIPAGNQENAHEIASQLLSKGFAVCVNIIPSQSMYLVNGLIEKVEEYILIVKTTQEMCERARKEVAQIHSYKRPCIINIAANCNISYAEYMHEEIGDD